GHGWRMAKRRRLCRPRGAIRQERSLARGLCASIRKWPSTKGLAVATTLQTSSAARDSEPRIVFCRDMRRMAPRKLTKAASASPLRVLADRVRQERARRAMPRKQLARDSGVSELYLAKIEGGKGNIPVLVLRKLAKALNVSVDALLFEG